MTANCTYSIHLLNQPCLSLFAKLASKLMRRYNCTCNCKCYNLCVTVSPKGYFGTFPTLYLSQIQCPSLYCNIYFSPSFIHIHPPVPPSSYLSLFLLLLMLIFSSLLTIPLSLIFLSIYRNMS